MRQTRLITLLLVVVVVVLGACSEGEKVGSGVKVGGGTGDAGGLRLGERTTTTAAADQQAAATTAPPTTQQQQTATTAAPTNTAPTTTAPTALEISIVDRSQYDPPIAQVAAGTTVRWTNRDTIERQIVATDGAFASPKIPPGGTWEWKATKRGDHAYADPDVPFAAGARLRVT